MTIKDTLDSEINSVLASNQAGGMTAADLRQVLDDIVTALPVPAGASGDIQTNDGAGGLASISRSGGASTDYLAYDNTYKPIPAGGGSGTPGGSNGQLQYNNAGTLGGLTIGGDAALNPGTGALTVTKTSGTAFSALATAAAVALGSQVSGVLPVANGGTGTGTPSLVAGSNVSISGAWPNQLISAASGGGGTVVGDSTATFNTRADAISATIATVATGGPSYIRTVGYAFVTDGGGGLYTRVGSTPNYSNLVWFSSADGQKWALVVKNEPLKLEQAGGGVSATASANSAAADAIHSIFYLNPSSYPAGYGPVGPCIQLGFGQYNFSGPWFVKGGSNIRGLGSGSAGARATVLKFPAGSDGLVLGCPSCNGRLFNAALYGSTYDARGTVIRDLAIEGGWVLNGTTPYSQNNSTGERGIGILSKATCQLENLYISGFAEFGVYIKGSAGGGGSATEPTPGTGDNTDSSESYVCAQGYANTFLMSRVYVETIGCDGFRDRGADANAGSYIECSADLCYAWGYNSLCFLGNFFWGCHSATNGFRWQEQSRLDTNTGAIPGAYQAADDSNASNFVACYSEGGQPGSKFRGFSSIFGGLHAAGSPTQSGSGVVIANGGGSAFSISPFSVGTQGGGFSVGQANVNNEVYNVNGEIFFRREFNTYRYGTFGVPDVSAITTSGYTATQGRGSALGSGHQTFPYGMWLGGPQTNSGFDLRFLGMSDGLPTSGQWARGDRIFMVNPSAGGAHSYVCTTGGDYAATPPVWKSVGNLAA